MERPWLYFGCADNTGHRLFGPGLFRIPDERFRRLLFDGSLCAPEAEGLYKASLSRLGGWGYSALAFWDRTGDSRPGSNSAFFAPDLTISAEDLLEGAKRHFPTICNRLPAIDISRAAHPLPFLREVG